MRYRDRKLSVSLLRFRAPLQWIVVVLVLLRNRNGRSGVE
jgi:hypothetical protein